ncbi:hypothetical protein NUM_07430 [Actinocatenispora comari]|uniref:Uncharacterized protein n=1 Tax=Actinocatenispora comari TaxID=2807577 RepID=A0A8J4AB24_9ACTN|nr:hypothetical protein NUM_07430 [Actinocatenispora comari]
MHVDGTPLRHNEYPHQAGTLYGCLLCEINCYCDALNRGHAERAPRVVCVHCAENHARRNDP